MNEILQAIEMVGREKGLGREIIIEALEEAMVAAAKKVLKTNKRSSAISTRTTEKWNFSAS